jgi:CarD family transcriptional regulator
MYSIGDKVVHPKHGAGRIADIIRRLDDSHEEVLYYVFEMTVCSMRVIIPVNSADTIGIRPIFSKDKIVSLLADVSSEEIEQDANWNKRFRENMDKVKSGDLTQVGSVIKALTLRDRDRGLSTGERKLLHAAKQIFASELELAAGISYEEAETMVDQAICA